MSRFKRELKEFRQFYKNYNFKMLELETRGEEIYYGDILVTDKEGKTIGESDKFINVGYKHKGSLPKLLSNLFPYDFVFRGKHISSIETIFQGIKFKDKRAQDLVLSYSGLDSNNIKAATDYDWKENGNIFWQGRAINRFSKEYDDFILEMYVAAIQNPLYRGALINADRYILHSIGETDNTKTVFTRYEFEKMLNTLSAYLKNVRER